MIVPSVSRIKKTVNARGVCPRETDKQSSGNGVGNPSDEIGDTRDAKKGTAPVNGEDIIAGARAQSIH